MGLETASYITGLNTSWPLAGDTKSQGDDHLRLLKSVLTLTFPNASKAFYIPSAEAFSSTITLDATDQNNLVMVDTTAGDIACTLPTLASGDKGWTTEIVRTNTGGGNNAIVVSPASGTINSAAGATATIRIERIFEPARFTWTGSVWFCVKPGQPVGSSMNWDSATAPAGYRAADGTALSSTTFAELFAVYGTATLKDKRGRVEAGIDTGGTRLSGLYFGTTAVVGALGGFEYNILTSATIPTHYHVAGIYDPTHTHSHNANTSTSTTGGGAFAIGGAVAATINANGTGVRVNSSNGLDTTYSTGSGSAHANVQPTIITNKLIRVA